MSDTPPTGNLLDELRERYPKAFPTDPEAVMPLMLYVHKVLIRAGYLQGAVSAALRGYVNSPAYLQALAAGKPRVNLDGEPVGFVSEAHQADAQARIENPDARRLAKQAKAPAIALAGTIDQPQEPPQRKPMPTIELTATLAKIAVTIDPAAFRAVLDVDTVGAKSVPVAIAVDGKKYLAQLNSKSFRKAQVAFKEAANPTVSISGNLKGNSIEAAGIQVFDKGAKAAEEGKQAKAPEPAPVVEPQTAAQTGGTGRPKLALKLKT